MVAEFSRDQKSSAQIHDFSSQHLKPLGWKRLGEEVSVVVLCANERHHDFLRLDHIAYEEVSPRDMLLQVADSHRPEEEGKLGIFFDHN